MGWYTGRTSPNTRDLVLKNTQVLYMIVMPIMMIYHIGLSIKIKNI